MKDTSAKVNWFEVVGQDAKRLQAFYGELFNWRLTEVPGMPEYALSDASQTGVAGGVGCNAGKGSWATFYVTVGDLEATLDRAVRLGGAAVSPPVTLADGGRIAIIKDPEGHVVGLHQVPA